ncbi:MAG TPA: ABC transporter substrate-binding protein [Acidimicrobiales bacterium]|nr:ABC transporter substrate-binding protein [Acidimicrobiales bacterium]
MALAAAVVAVVAAACSSSPSASNSTSTTATTAPSGAATTTPGAASSPGVSATTVTVGQVDDLTAPLPGLFKGAEDGTEAYFDYVNSLGGVNGRKIVLDAKDSAYSDGTVANATSAQITSDFALVGGFSLDDAAEEPLVKAAGMPDIAYPLDPELANLPDSYSPVPNNDNDVPLTIFKLLRAKFPTQVKHMGILWANATAATASAEQAFERAARHEGFKIVYDASFTPSQTTFLANVLTMKAKGVQMFFTQQLPDSYAATVAEEMQQQNFHPINVEEDAYSANLVKDGGSAVNGMYIEINFVLYLGADSNLPAVKLFTKWMKTADPTANFELESLYGWAAAQLFVEGLRDAGNPPTRAGLETALDKITSFNAGGLVTTADPATNVPGACVILAQVQGSQIVRVPPTPKTGFYCLPDSLLPAPGFKPEVRPSPGS